MPRYDNNRPLITLAAFNAIDKMLQSKRGKKHFGEKAEAWVTRPGVIQVVDGNKILYTIKFTRNHNATRKNNV